MNSLPKTVTRQRRDYDLNPGPSTTESSTLTTRLPTRGDIFRRQRISRAVAVGAGPVQRASCRRQTPSIRPARSRGCLDAQRDGERDHGRLDRRGLGPATRVIIASAAVPSRYARPTNNSLCLMTNARHFPLPRPTLTCRLAWRSG